MRFVRCKCTDRTAACRNNGKVGGYSAVAGIQCRNQRLRRALSPECEETERRGWNYRGVQRKRLSVGGRATTAGRNIHAERSTEGLRAQWVSGVEHPARR